MLEHNIGDTLIVTDEDSGHKFHIGELVVVTELIPNQEPPYYQAKSLGRDREIWYIHDGEAIKAEENGGTN